MSVPQSLEGFDVSAAVERMLGIPELWWQSLAIFVEHYAGWEALWASCIGDDAKEQKCVHALCGAAANVGAVDLSRHAAALEALLLMRLAGRDEVVPASLREDLRASFRRSLGGAAEALATEGTERA